MLRSVMAEISARTPAKLGQLVDAFLADEGRIHVGDEQPFPAVGGGDDGDVDRVGRERLWMSARMARFAAGSAAKANLDGFFGCKPAARPGGGKIAARSGNQARRKPSAPRRGDQDGDEWGGRHQPVARSGLDRDGIARAEGDARS